MAVCPRMQFQSSPLVLDRIVKYGSPAALNAEQPLLLTARRRRHLQPRFGYPIPPFNLHGARFLLEALSARSRYIGTVDAVGWAGLKTKNQMTRRGAIFWRVQTQLV